MAAGSTASSSSSSSSGGGGGVGNEEGEYEEKESGSPGLVPNYEPLAMLPRPTTAALALKAGIPAQAAASEMVRPSTGETDARHCPAADKPAVNRTVALKQACCQRLLQ